MKNNKLYIFLIVLLGCAVIVEGVLLFKEKNNKDEKSDNTKTEIKDEKDNNTTDEKDDSNIDIKEEVVSDGISFKLYKKMEETISLQNKEYKITRIVYKGNGKCAFNTDSNCQILAENIYLNSKELLPLTAFASTSEDLDDLDIFISKNGALVSKLKDKNNNDDYIFISYNKKESDTVYKSIVEVYDIDLKKMYSYDKQTGRPFIWLEFKTKDDAGDRNVTYEDGKYKIYLYNSKGISGNAQYDLHDNYFYLFDTKKENINVGAYEYLISFNNGEISKESRFFSENGSEYTTEQTE